MVSWTAVVGLASYIRLKITTIFRYQGGKSLVLVGAWTQIGSFVGAILSFFVVNYTNVFSSFDPCAAWSELKKLLSAILDSEFSFTFELKTFKRCKEKHRTINFLFYTRKMTEFADCNLIEEWSSKNALKSIVKACEFLNLATLRNTLFNCVRRYINSSEIFCFIAFLQSARVEHVRMWRMSRWSFTKNPLVYLRTLRSIECVDRLKSALPSNFWNK